MHDEPQKIVTIGEAPLVIEDVVLLASGRARAALSASAAWRERIEESSAWLHRHLEKGGVVYGVNTGYGDSCERTVPPELMAELPLNLTRYHGCGLGRELDAESTAAVLVARIASLARGNSGVRLILLERLCQLLNRRMLPLVPEEGSVGASGDLTPLSYVAAVLIGEREVSYEGRRLPTSEAFALAGIEPIELGPKEALAVMNGTAVMTGLACLAFDRAQDLMRLASTITALAVVALNGNPEHYDARLFALKPHPGTQGVAGWIEAGIRSPAGRATKVRVQDPYSLRCAPHVIGVLADTLPWIRSLLETELNSANDNPLILAEEDCVLHGGHFYGGHVAISMDTLKTAVANIADLLDRQLELLVDVRHSRGLPPNLSGSTPDRAAVNHGFKAVQIATSAWTAEALKTCMPASVFSRSTECHNQDKVSLGTISARDALRVLELTEQVAAAVLLAVVQGVWLRLEKGELHQAQLSDEVRRMLATVRSDFAPLVEDRPLDTTLRTVLARMRAGAYKPASSSKEDR